MTKYTRNCRICAVKGCKSTKRKNKYLSFFYLPADEERLKTWTELIGRPDLAGPNTKKKSHCVCSLHFDRSVIKYTPKLLPDALPTKLLPDSAPEPTTSKSNPNAGIKESSSQTECSTVGKSLAATSKSPEVKSEATRTNGENSSSTQRRRRLKPKPRLSSSLRKLLIHLLLYHMVYAKELNSIVEEKIASTNFKNISDDKLIIDQRTFINDNGFRRSGDEKPILRRPPKYYTPSERALNLKILDMMRQSIYDTQYDIQRLDPVLEKYKNDPAFRMAFIFNRLEQLIIDIRRVYTLALKWRDKKRVYEQIIWYSHCVRKHIDVLYIVEHLIDKHNEYMKIAENK